MEADLFRVTRRSAAGRVFVVLWGGLAVVDIGRLSGSALVTGSLVVLLTAACGVGQSLPAAAAVAGTGWLVIDGFVQHEYGELGFGPASWWLLGLVLAVALTISVRTTRVGGGR